MISNIFNTLFYQPLYNALVGLINIVPFADVGLAVIALTLIVKCALFPLSQKALITQKKMKEIEGPLNVIKEKFKDKPEELAKETMAIYKANNINPFSGILLIFIQIPVILALYWVFLKGNLPVIHTDILYSFIHVPLVVNMKFLGLIDIHSKSTVLALCAGVSQFLQAHYSLRDQKFAPLGTSFKDDMLKGMNIQMRFILPFFVFAFGLALSGAVTLYWTVSNLFTVAQELYIRKVGLK